MVINTLAIQNTEIDVVNTTTETAILSYSVPGGTLGTDAALRINLVCDSLSAVASSFTFRVKYGATTMYADATISFTLNASRRPVIISLLLFPRNVTNSQGLSGHVAIGPFGGADTGIGNAATDEIDCFGPIYGATASEDSTAAKTLAITIQHSTANSGVSFRRLLAVVESISTAAAITRVEKPQIYKNNLLGRVSRPRIFKNHMLGRISKPHRYIARLLTRVTRPRIYIARLLTRVTEPRIYRYNLFQRITRPRTYIARLLQRVTDPTIYKNHMLGRITKPHRYIVRLLTRVTDSQIYKNHVLQRVTKPRIYIARLLTRVTRPRIYIARLLSRVTDARIYKANIIGRITKPRIFRNNMIGRIVQPRIYRNAMLGRVSLNRRYIARLLTRVTLPRIYRARLLQRVTLPRIYIARILQRVTDPAIYRYNLIGRITKPRIYKNNLIGRISLVRRYISAVEARVTSSKIYRYHMLGRIVKPQIYRYNLFKRVALVRVFKNHIAGRIKLIRIYQSRLLTRVTRPRIYIARLLTRITRPRIYRYNMLGRVTKPRIFRYNLRSLVQLARIYRNSMIGRIIKSNIYRYSILQFGRVTLTQIYRNNMVGRISKVQTLVANILNRVGDLNCIKFDGINDMATIPSIGAINNLDDFSMGYWLYPVSMGTSTPHVFIKGYPSNNGIIAYWSGGGVTPWQLQFRIVNDSAVNTIIFTTYINDNGIDKWYHIFFTFNRASGAMKIYVDGIERKAGTAAGVAANVVGGTVNLSLNGGGGAAKWGGYAKDFRLFRSELSAQDVLKIYNNDPSAPTPNYWQKMEEGSGNPVDEMSVNQMTFSGGTAWAKFAPDVWLGTVQRYISNLIGRIELPQIYQYHVLGRIALVRRYISHVLQRVGTIAVRFDGVNDHINCGNHADLWSQALTNFSFSVWIYPQDIVNDVDRGIINQGWANIHAFYLYNSASLDNIVWTMKRLDGVNMSCAATPPGGYVVNRWYHVTCTLDSTLPGNNMRMYINGVQTGTIAAFTETKNAAFALTLSVSSNDFAGTMKDFRWWNNKTLTPQEVVDVYTDTTAAPSPNYWLKLDEGKGNPVDAISGTKTGTMTSGAYWVALAPDVWPSKWQRYISNLIGRISNTRSYRYNVLERVALVRTYANHMRALISRVRIYRYNLKQRVALARIYKSNVLIKIILVRLYRYRILTKVSLPRIYKYGVLARRTVSSVYKSNILNKILLARIYKNNMVARVSLTRDYLYNVLSAITHVALVQTYLYNMRARVATTETYRYNVLHRLTLPRIYRNNMRSFVQLVRIYRNAMRAKISLPRIYKSNVLNKIILVRSYRYNVKGFVHVVRQYQYNITARLTVLRIYRYNLRAKISQPRIYRNNMFGRIALSRIYKNNILGITRITHRYIANILQTVSQHSDYQYNILSKISFFQKYLYNVAQFAKAILPTIPPLIKQKVETIGRQNLRTLHVHPDVEGPPLGQQTKSIFERTWNGLPPQESFKIESKRQKQEGQEIAESTSETTEN